MNYGEGGTPASSSVSVRQRDPDVIRDPSSHPKLAPVRPNRGPTRAQLCPTWAQPGPTWNAAWGVSFVINYREDRILVLSPVLDPDVMRESSLITGRVGRQHHHLPLVPPLSDYLGTQQCSKNAKLGGF